MEFYKLLALYHADSKAVVKHCHRIQNVVCVGSFTYFLLLHCWGCLRINLLQEISNEASALVRLILATALGLVSQLITVIRGS